MLPHNSFIMTLKMNYAQETAIVSRFTSIAMIERAMDFS